jgi:hypothetical protein
VAKRGVLEHEKTIMLAETLDIMEPFALGVLEAFWQWVAKYRPSGDLSSTRPSLMARSIRYTADPQALWNALAECGFIDLDGDRATVHDWSDHAEDSVHMRLARSTQRFADGSKPNMRRIPHDERAKLEAAFVRTESAPVAHDMSTDGALPLPKPKPMPSISPQPPLQGGVKLRKSEAKKLATALTGVYRERTPDEQEAAEQREAEGRAEAMEFWRGQHRRKSPAMRDCPRVIREALDAEVRAGPDSAGSEMLAGKEATEVTAA